MDRFGHCDYPHPFHEGELREAVYVRNKSGRIDIGFLNPGSVSGPALVVDRKDFLEKARNIR